MIYYIFFGYNKNLLIFVLLNIKNIKFRSTASIWRIFSLSELQDR